MYQVEFLPRALRQLRKLSGSVQHRILQQADELAVDPRPRGVEKLRGKEDQYRVRVGDYRILYEVTDEKLLVCVVKVGHRREIYR